MPVHDFDYSQWVRRCEAALRACCALGGECGELSVGKPASEREVREVESALGLVLPPSFRKVLTDFCSSFDVSWFLPDELRVPSPLQEIFSGGMSWNLRKLGELEKTRQGWVAEVFPDSADAYDRVWHGKLALHEVGNGDMLALDLEVAQAPLVYLSHDDGEGHGYCLGDDLADAMERWTQLGCVGAEDWQWLPFTASGTGGIDPRCANAALWREWFGIDRKLSVDN